MTATKRGCFHCNKAFTESFVDHAYRYDHGAPIQLRSIARCSCDCGYYEIAIPKMTALHEAIAQALIAQGVDRAAIAFIFEKGSRGVEDGMWRQTTASTVDEAPAP
jgi:hypothetical protein